MGTAGGLTAWVGGWVVVGWRAAVAAPGISLIVPTLATRSLFADGAAAAVRRRGERAVSTSRAAAHGREYSLCGFSVFGSRLFGDLALAATGASPGGAAPSSSDDPDAPSDDDEWPL
tara:strand:+ start:186 stop:536 length:351 start_codon:yes stop_codon:yes gene_type:complete